VSHAACREEKHAEHSLWGRPLRGEGGGVSNADVMTALKSAKKTI
jgi:hypothetical protein